MTISSIALNDSVLKTWDEIVRRFEEKIPAEKPGRGHPPCPNSVKDFSHRLFPIRELLREAAKPLLSSIPTYEALKLGLSQLHQQSQKGPLLRGYIWIYASKTRELTSGKIQMTFCPDGVVRSEYVAYRITQPNRKYHIQNISQWLRSPKWFSQFRKGCSQLRRGFELMCKSGDGKRIEKMLHEISDSDWDSLHLSGLDTDAYFVIHYDRHRDDVLHLTVEELAQLFIADFADLAPLYPLLQGTTTGLGPAHTSKISPIVRGTIRTTTPIPRRMFRPEFSGERSPYTLSGPIRSRCLHGVVVDALSKMFSLHKIQFFNSKALDLYTLSNKDCVTAIFEAKTDTSTSSIYTAVGQLMLHGAGEEETPMRVIVTPGEPVSRTADVFRKIGIHVVTYKWNGETPEFMGLDEIFDSLSASGSTL